MLALPALGAPVRAAAVPRVASLDYGLGETLIAIGRPPVALPDLEGWRKWVVAPPLPPGVVDLGLDLAPNMEVLSALSPDLILSTDYVAGAEPALRRIAPVERLTLYGPGLDPLEAARTALSRLGDRLGARAAAARYLEDTEAFFEAGRARAARLSPGPILLASLLDARHARVYGASGLYGKVLARLGIANAWAAPDNYWGFATVGIEAFWQTEATRLVTFDPLPPDAMGALARSPIWTALPFARQGAVSVLEPSLMFGGLPSARRFAALLLGELERRSA
ncbi:ABC transporter substrate-binding protein [Aurantimonas sp. Leaf443]|uniref:ABC transporter substrate-binding protein n=1 Tax=Aurantimonas sp. Leaf443 TaxID=1736378 RepID=UPI0006FA0068|nr:ABC transporter substrate-binding protein [Aurantimonas sp. Leaf443]KQT85393.1 hypothetical protein ASG48_09155 [Aurantimonas sp. Leaf443]